MNKTQQSIELWMPYARPKPWAKLRLFCFPHAGSCSRMYRSWPLFLPDDIEVCPVELPGRGLRISEPSFISLQPLVNSIGMALAYHLDKPFAFFGHSMGALISFELAHHIRKEYGKSPLHLFLSSNPAPQLSGNELRKYLLPDPEFIRELKRLNGMPDEIFEHDELLQIILPAIRADFQVCESYVYQPRPPLDCPIMVFGGSEDREVPPEDLDLWRKLTTSTFKLNLFPGDHFYLNSFQDSILDILSREMEIHILLEKSAIKHERH